MCVCVRVVLNVYLCVGMYVCMYVCVVFEKHTHDIVIDCLEFHLYENYNRVQYLIAVLRNNIYEKYQHNIIVFSFFISHDNMS